MRSHAFHNWIWVTYSVISLCFPSAAHAQTTTDLARIEASKYLPLLDIQPVNMSALDKEMAKLANFIISGTEQVGSLDATGRFNNANTPMNKLLSSKQSYDWELTYSSTEGCYTETLRYSRGINSSDYYKFRDEIDKAYSTRVTVERVYWNRILLDETKIRLLSEDSALILLPSASNIAVMENQDFTASPATDYRFVRGAGWNVRTLELTDMQDGIWSAETSRRLKAIRYMYSRFCTAAKSASPY